MTITATNKDRVGVATVSQNLRRCIFSVLNAIGLVSYNVNYS